MALNQKSMHIYTFLFLTAEGSHWTTDIEGIYFTVDWLKATFLKAAVWIVNCVGSMAAFHSGFILKDAQSNGKPRPSPSNSEQGGHDVHIMSLQLLLLQPTTALR